MLTITVGHSAVMLAVTVELLTDLTSCSIKQRQDFMNTKANLKNAREALGAKKYAEAVKFCNRVLDFESQNYNAYVHELSIAYPLN